MMITIFRNLILFTVLFGQIGSVMGAPMHGLNFGPYVNDPGAPQSPPPGPPDTVTTARSQQLLSVIAPYTSWVRTFGADSGLENVPAVAKGLGLNVAMGAFLVPSTQTNAAAINETQKVNLIAAAAAGHVDIAVVGSETLLSGSLTGAQLVGHIQDVRQRLDNAYLSHIPVTTAEPFGTFVNNLPNTLFDSNGNVAKTEVIQAIDVMFLNIYPFFEDGIQIDNAVNKLGEMYNTAVAAIDAVSPGTKVIISETGWASAGAGPAIGGAPSLSNAERYFNEAVAWGRNNNVELFYFEAFDEEWKGLGGLEYEANFGLWDADLQPKFPIPEPTSLSLLAPALVLLLLRRKYRA